MTATPLALVRAVLFWPDTLTVAPPTGVPLLVTVTISISGEPRGPAWPGWRHDLRSRVGQAEADSGNCTFCRFCRVKLVLEVDVVAVLPVIVAGPVAGAAGHCRSCNGAHGAVPPTPPAAMI